VNLSAAWSALRAKSHRWVTKRRLPHAYYGCLAILLFPHLALQEGCWVCHVGQWLDLPAHVEKADAIVILGGGMSERLPPAVMLYQEDIAPQIWITGASAESQAGDGTTAQISAKQASDMGVPTEAITLLATTSTWEDGEQIAATVRARGFRSIVVVTSWYHGRRALCSIHHHLQDDSVKVYYQPAATPGYDPDDWWLTKIGGKIVTMELEKTIFYWGYYGLVPWIC